MIINFGKGKCPVCGDAANRDKEIFRCNKCNLAFDDFSLIDYDEKLDEHYVYWT